MFTGEIRTHNDDLRAQQIADGRRMANEEGGEAGHRTLSLARRPNNKHQRAAVEKRSALKGHEAFLKALELSGADVIIEKLSGVTYRGKLKHSDKFTLTVAVKEVGHAEDYGLCDFKPLLSVQDRVVFKHDISEFRALQRNETPEVAEEAVPA